MVPDVNTLQRYLMSRPEDWHARIQKQARHAPKDDVCIAVNPSKNSYTANISHALRNACTLL